MGLGFRGVIRDQPHLSNTWEHDSVVTNEGLPAGMLRVQGLGVTCVVLAWTGKSWGRHLGFQMASDPYEL